MTTVSTAVICMRRFNLRSTGLSSGDSLAEVAEEPQPEPAEEPVEAQVAGFAWMRAAGVTHPDKMCVRTTTIRARHAILPPALRLFSNDPIRLPLPATPPSSPRTAR